MDLRLEFRRQIAHFLLGIAIVNVYIFTDLSPYYLFALGVLSEAIFLLNSIIKLPFVNWLVNMFERKEDINRFPGRGFITFFMGASIVLLAFPRDIALAAIIVLAAGDSVSNIFGKLFGKIKHPGWLSKHKTLEGSFAGWLVAFNLTIFFVTPLEALVASSFGMFIEVIEIRFHWAKLEDNLTIPLIAALAIYALRMFTG